MIKKHLFVAMLISLMMVFSYSVNADEMKTSTTSFENEVFKERWITTNKTHQYLGLGALALGTLTAISPKPSQNDYKDSLHYNLAWGATYLGGAALATGFVFHYKDLSWNKIFRNPDNLHALFATIGTLGFLLAVDIAPEESHSTPGIIGLAGMATAVKITW